MLEEGPSRQLRQGTSEEFTIPAEAVGYVIGRQGQRVREMEKSSGARIRFKDQQDSEDKARGHRLVVKEGGLVYLPIPIISRKTTAWHTFLCKYGAIHFPVLAAFFPQFSLQYNIGKMCVVLCAGCGNKWQC